MKKDKTYWTLELLQIIFFAVLPLALFFWKCTTINAMENGGSKFIVGCSGYIVFLLIFIVCKKVILKKYLADLNGKTINYSTQLETETDQTKIPLIEKALRKCLLMRDIFNIAPMLIVIGLLLLVVKALEKDIITLYAVIGMCAISYIIGFVLLLIQDANIKSKNRKVENGTSENTQD